jgi:hypothetical protein
LEKCNSLKWQSTIPDKSGRAGNTKSAVGNSKNVKFGWADTDRETEIIRQLADEICLTPILPADWLLTTGTWRPATNLKPGKSPHEFLALLIAESPVAG